jgi:hypothetical protein
LIRFLRSIGNDLIREIRVIRGWAMLWNDRTARNLRAVQRN